MGSGEGHEVRDPMDAAMLQKGDALSLDEMDLLAGSYDDAADDFGADDVDPRQAPLPIGLPAGEDLEARLSAFASEFVRVVEEQAEDIARLVDRVDEALDDLPYQVHQVIKEDIEEQHGDWIELPGTTLEGAEAELHAFRPYTRGTTEVDHVDLSIQMDTRDENGRLVHEYHRITLRRSDTLRLARFLVATLDNEDPRRN